MNSAGRPNASDSPLIAYLDWRISEIPAVERLAQVCVERDIALAEPRVLRSAGLGEMLPEMRQAALTVSCSYHVARPR